MVISFRIINRTIRNIFKGAADNELYFSDYILPEEKVLASKISKQTPYDQIKSYVYDGLSIGEHAYAGALRYYARGDLNNEFFGEQILRRYLKSALLTVFCMDRVLEQNNYDVVFAACSNITAFEESILLAAKGGFVNLFGGIRKNASDTVSFSSNFVHYRQISIGGTFSSTKKHHETAINYLSSGKIKTELLITHEFNLSDFNEAINVVSSGDGLKVIINT